MRSANETLETNGIGYWSLKAKSVAITGLSVPYISEDKKHGELRVYFDTSTWDVENDGLIYTDKGFLVELRNYLERAGYKPERVFYSEQGMQGDNFVSFDVDERFLKSWERE